ncbi:MAG TPA: hypothetical protein GX716_00665 [Firmicutes bacterium]|nr:hypothetical protein [Candidatus Fermentithermobacillaceae bacterium]
MGVKNAQRLIEARFRKPAKQLVHELYYGQGMSQAQVAKHLGVSHMTVWGWMKEWEWPTRRFTVVEIPPLELEARS